MKRILVAGLVFITWAACTNKREHDVVLKTGQWRAVLELQGQHLPFNLEVVRDAQGGYDAYLINGDERLLLDEVAIQGDSVDMGLHIFDADMKARVNGDSLTGVFVKNYEKNYQLPFTAVHGEAYRFAKHSAARPAADFTGKYDVAFLRPADTEAGKMDTAKAVGLFHQSGTRVSGTFMTPTGDYRFLEGDAIDSTMQLSTFDGNHAYLFRASMQRDGSLRGEFFSGKTLHEQWIARRNERAALPDAESLTYLKEGYDRIAFSFPNPEGKQVSLDDEKYKGKVVIVQLLGTWCPNCMDETRFLAPWYQENKHRGVEIIGLAYERKPDFGYASTRVKKMAAKMDVAYDILIAGTNTDGSPSASLPMLNAVKAFPTTIFIGRDGKVKKIHTGFNGPGTGEYYDEFIRYFNETVNELLKDGFTAQK